MITGKRAWIVAFLLVLCQITIGGQRANNGTVTGQVKGTGGTPAIGVRVAAIPATDSDAQNGSALVSLAETGPDGRYLLEGIPAGRYYIQAGFLDGPSFYPGVSSKSDAASVVVSAGATVNGIDFTATRGVGVRVSGRVSANVNPLPARVALVGAKSLTAEVGPDGAFEFLRVSAGSYSITAVPPNTLLPAMQIVVNDKDVQVGMPVGPGFRVSGIVGLGPQSPNSSNLKVVLSGSNAWSQLESPVSGNVFEFSSVPAGVYSLLTIPGASTDSIPVTVTDREIRGIIIPALVQLTGRVLLDDGGGLPSSPVALMIGATRSDGTAFVAAVIPNGVFRFPLKEGEYRIEPGKLPAGVSVKSMTYGAVDLLENVVRLNGTAAPSEIVLTLQKKR